MKKRKNYGRKIKRSKINLYPKKKTKAQKIIGTIVLILIILAIVFLGYCLGKPLFEFIEKNTGGTGKDSPAWTPPAETAQTEEPSDTSADGSSVTASQQNDSPDETENTRIYAVSVPDSALSNSVSLSAFASKAASEGYTAAAVCLKDSSGAILYNTQTVPAKDSEAVAAYLSAEEISNILSRNGLTPVAYVAVLSDNEGGRLNPDMCYKIVDEPEISWLDYFSAEGNPIRWSNPGSEAAKVYNKAITDELKRAGFEQIILTHVVFPPFQEYDREFISSEYFAADRYKLLDNVVFDNTSLLVYAEDIIIGNMNGSAEVLKNKSALYDNPVIVKINREAFTAEKGFPADASALLEDVMAQCSKKCTGIKLVPMVDKTDFTSDDIASMRKKAEEIGYADFYIK